MVRKNKFAFFCGLELRHLLIYLAISLAISYVTNQQSWFDHTTKHNFCPLKAVVWCDDCCSYQSSFWTNHICNFLYSVFAFASLRQCNGSTTDSFLTIDLNLGQKYEQSSCNNAELHTVQLCIVIIYKSILPHCAYCRIANKTSNFRRWQSTI